MYKNQLQELAQRSCFNLPSYACIREGPDHAPRFKALVNFNGEVFQSPNYCPTLRQAEHAAAELALNLLSARGPSKSLTARVLDETGIYKNLLQETAHRAGLRLPVYATERSGPGHQPVFTTTVELASMSFTGEHAKTKKQAEKNAAIAAWSALKTMANLKTDKDVSSRDDHELVIKILSSLRSTDECKQTKKRDQNQSRQQSVNTYGGGLTAQRQKSSFMSLLPPPPPRTTSKILPPNPTPLLNRLITTDQSIKGKSPVRLPDTNVPIQEHKKDDDWFLLYTKLPDFIKKFAIDKETSANSTSMGSSSTTRIGMPIYTGGYNGVHKIAPAVHVRSVIPVCSAPVQIKPPQPQPQPPSTGGANQVPPMLNKSKTQVETQQQLISTQLKKLEL